MNEDLSPIKHGFPEGNSSTPRNRCRKFPKNNYVEGSENPGIPVEVDSLSLPLSRDIYVYIYIPGARFLPSIISLCLD